MATRLTYVIPDLHGRFDLLIEAIARIEMHAAGQSATLVALGDYIDRGPYSGQVIERLMGWKSEDLYLIALKGNHEETMWQTCNVLPDAGWWIRNGGDQTLLSYGQVRAEPPNLLLVPHHHLDWIAGLPLLHADEHRVYVHAAVDPIVPLDQQTSKILLWKRYPDGFDRGHGERHVFHGHHAMAKGPMLMKHRTNLDTMAWKTGRLIVGVFDDRRPGGPVDIIEIRGPRAS